MAHRSLGQQVVREHVLLVHREVPIVDRAERLPHFDLAEATKLIESGST